MPLLESIGIAVFLILVVFLVLLCLWGCIRLFSFAVSRLEQLPGKEKRTKNNSKV